MSRGAQSFKQGDVTKAVKGVVKAGLEVQRVEWEAGRSWSLSAREMSVSPPTKPVADGDGSEYQMAEIKLDFVNFIDAASCVISFAARATRR